MLLPGRGAATRPGCSHSRWWCGSADGILAATIAATIVALGGCDAQRGAIGSAPPVAVVSVSTADSAEPTATAAIEREIVAIIQSSQRGGLIGRDPEAYLRIWTPDARLISARRERPDEYDYVLPRKVFEKAARVRSRGEVVAPFEMRYRDEQVEVTGDRATVTWTLRVSWKEASGVTGEEIDAERYQLTKTADGWRVRENRFWPKRMVFGDREVRYDDAKWAEFDAAVARAKASGDDATLLLALSDAWHFVEGLELARELTKRSPDNAEHWLWRARFADRLRDVDEAIAAYRQIKRIDPHAPVPDWVEVALSAAEHPTSTPARD